MKKTLRNTAFAGIMLIGLGFETSDAWEGQSCDTEPIKKCTTLQQSSGLDAGKSYTDCYTTYKTTCTDSRYPDRAPYNPYASPYERP